MPNHPVASGKHTGLNRRANSQTLVASPADILLAAGHNHPKTPVDLPAGHAPARLARKIRRSRFIQTLKTHTPPPVEEIFPRAVTAGDRLLLAVCILGIAAVWAASITESSGAVATDRTAARVLTERVGDVTHIYVENSELSEVTMTFDFCPVNLEASVPLPHTATFRPGRTEAFTLTPADPGKPWDFSYTNYYKLGSSVAEHDDSCVYLLPYAPGRAYRVTQGYNGKFSHTGANQYATDWQMPEGTPIRAARGGLVVKMKDDSDKGGGSMKYDRYNNYVLIRHDDGTLGHYCHLKKDTVKIKPGETVSAGDTIASSGNTGFSTGAHLHFAVFKTRNGRERITIPVKFYDQDRGPVTLVQGRKYEALPTQTAHSDAGTRISTARARRQPQFQGKAGD